MGLFNSFSLRRKISDLEQEVARLKALWTQVEQDWDATSARVSKVLRRLRASEEAAERAGGGTDVDVRTGVPTTVPAASGRLQKIKEQLAAAGRSE
jgi:hypothetical protein